MSGTAGHGAKIEICDVAGCEKESERSLNYKQVSKTSLELKPGEHHSVHLCKEHYKTYKKESKQDREINSIY
jgi:hypothetical protein